MATVAVGLVQFRRQQVGPASRDRLSTDQIGRRQWRHFAVQLALLAPAVAPGLRRIRGDGYGAAFMGRRVAVMSSFRWEMLSGSAISLLVRTLGLCFLLDVSPPGKLKATWASTAVALSGVGTAWILIPLLGLSC